jgi:hypothetical protein
MTRDERYERFTRDFSGRDGFRTHYVGRYFFVGPAIDVEADQLQDVIRATDVHVQWDRMGKTGLVVYPT